MSSSQAAFNLGFDHGLEGRRTAVVGHGLRQDAYIAGHAAGTLARKNTELARRNAVRAEQGFLTATRAGGLDILLTDLYAFAAAAGPDAWDKAVQVAKDRVEGLT